MTGDHGLPLVDLTRHDDIRVIGTAKAPQRKPYQSHTGVAEAGQPGQFQAAYPVTIEAKSVNRAANFQGCLDGRQ